MKKIFLFCIMFIMFIVRVGATDVGLAKNSESAILVEASTGKILFEKEKDKKMAPASMTKIMTMLIAMEEIEKGNLKLDAEVLISKNAQSMGGTVENFVIKRIIGYKTKKVNYANYNKVYMV